jgi:hypothetical protein
LIDTESVAIRPADYAGAARVALAMGMNRLAARLEAGRSS